MGDGTRVGGRYLTVEGFDVKIMVREKTQGLGRRRIYIQPIDHSLKFRLYNF